MISLPFKWRMRKVLPIGFALVVAGLICLGCRQGKPQAQAASATAPSEPKDPLERAKYRTQKGDTAGAVAVYSEILQHDPGNLAALGNRATLLEAMGKWQAALVDYNQLLFVDPNNLPAMDRRASLAFQMGHYDSALQDLLTIAAHREGDAALTNRIGEVHLRLGEYAKALRAFEETLRIGGSWPVAIRNRANTYYNMGDYAHAQEDFDYLLGQNPKDSEALNGLGLLMQFAEGDLLQAETYFRKAILANANNAGAWYNIGFLEAGQNKVDAAIEDFNQAIRCDKRYAEAYVNRGLLEMRRNTATPARTDFETALSLQPNNVHTRLLLGWAKCETGARAAGCIDLADAKAQAEPGAEKLIATYCR